MPTDRFPALHLARLRRTTAIACAAAGLTCLTPLLAQVGTATARTPTPVPATPAAAGPAWAGLTPAQRSALAPLERDWASIDAQRKAKWLEIASRFPRMPADEQARVRERMTEWARMTPAERGRARLSFQDAQRLTPQERQASWEAYQALPDSERRALAAQATTSLAPKPATGFGPATTLAPVPKQSSATVTPPQPPRQPVAPAMVQGRPGATTTSIAKPPVPPAHQQPPGQPKIAARPGQVDRATLLPRKTAAADGPAALPSAPRLAP